MRYTTKDGRRKKSGVGWPLKENKYERLLEMQKRNLDDIDFYYRPVVRCADTSDKK